MAAPAEVVYFSLEYYDDQASSSIDTLVLIRGQDISARFGLDHTGVL